MNQPKQNEKFFYMNLKKKVAKNAKNGTAYYTGKYAYAIDVFAFEKKDGSGDLTLWLSPKDMDAMKQQTQAQQGNHPYSPKPQAPKPQQRPQQKQGYVDHTQAKPNGWDSVPMPDAEDEIPF